MARWITQSDFTSGELDPRGIGRRDLERFPTAVALARNVSIDKLGSIRARGGWRWVDDVPVDAKVQLRGWQRDDDDYLLAIDTAGNLHVYGSDDVLDETLIGDADGVVLSVVQRDTTDTPVAENQTQEHTATSGSNRQAFGVATGPLSAKVEPGWSFPGGGNDPTAMASVLIRENVGASPAFEVEDRTFKDQAAGATTWDDASHDFNANADLCLVLVAAGEDDEVQSVQIDPDGTPVALAQIATASAGGGSQVVEIWGKYDVSGLGQNGATPVRVVMDGNSSGSFAVVSVVSAVGLPTDADLATASEIDNEINTTVTVPDGGFGVSSIGMVDTTSDSKTMLFFHEDVEPHWLHFTQGEGFVFEPFPIEDFPYHRFQAPGVTIKPSNTTGTITLTTSEAHWLPTHVGSVVRIGADHHKVSVTVYTSSTVVSATVTDTLDDTNATEEWDEQVWSDGRGWPISGCWHQARLVIGGARDLQDGFWVSKIASGDENPGSSFDIGDGEADDNAIWTRLRADEGVNIEYVRSQGPLLILASGTEWIVPQQPLTPTDRSFDRQASQGVARLKPADLDGAIVYLRASRAPDADDGGEQPIIHFAWDELSQRYRVSDISVLSQHLLDNPIDMAAARGSTRDANNVLYLANSDGTIAVLHMPTIERPGMTLFDGELSIYSVAVSAGRLYGAAEYNGAHRIFRLDPDSSLDASAAFEISSSTTVGTFAWLADQDVTVKGLTATGWTIQTATADGSGVVTVGTAVTKGEVGLPFEWKLRLLTPEAADATVGSLKSPVQARIMVKDTLDIEVGDEDGRTAMTLEDGSALGDFTTDPPTAFSGFLRDHLQGGWSEDPVVELGGTKPWSATVLVANVEVEF